MHVIPKAEWGSMVLAPWQYTHGYVVWYFRISHPKILLTIERDPPRPANEEQITYQKHARYMPNSPRIIRSCINFTNERSGGDLTVEEHRYVLSRIRTTCMPATTYSMTETRRHDRAP